MFQIPYLLSHSNLPGPRGNLELLYQFSRSADPPAIESCLQYLTDDLKNSPEEFVGMCGILGFAVYHAQDKPKVLEFLRPFASHSSWRIRESVAMGIQEISVGTLDSTLPLLAPWVHGNAYEQRAVVAGLCEPKLLKNEQTVKEVLVLLKTITQGFDHDRKLSEAETSLRQTLGYGWSVAIVGAPTSGKAFFEELVLSPGKHVLWILRENLKKNRLKKMDGAWVEGLLGASPLPSH